MRAAAVVEHGIDLVGLLEAPRSKQLLDLVPDEDTSRSDLSIGLRKADKGNVELAPVIVEAEILPVTRFLEPPAARLDRSDDRAVGVQPAIRTVERHGIDEAGSVASCWGPWYCEWPTQ